MEKIYEMTRIWWLSGENVEVIGDRPLPWAISGGGIGRRLREGEEWVCQVVWG